MVLFAQDFSPDTGIRMPLPPAVGVALAVDDLTLARHLRRALGTQAGLIETAEPIADVVVTDRDDAVGRNVLRLGASALQTDDVELIVAAARLRAAGYRIEREPEQSIALATVERRPLSQRERQVAELLVDGASNKVIARALDISVHTAKFHVTAILEKLGARNRADAVSILLREQLLAA